MCTMLVLPQDKIGNKQTSRLCSSSAPILLASSSLATFSILYTYEPSLLLNSSTNSFTWARSNGSHAAQMSFSWVVLLG